MSSRSLCLLMSVSDAYVFLFDFVKFVCAVHKPACVLLFLAAVHNYMHPFAQPLFGQF